MDNFKTKKVLAIFFYEMRFDIQHPELLEGEMVLKLP